MGKKKSAHWHSSILGNQTEDMSTVRQRVITFSKGGRNMSNKPYFTLITGNNAWPIMMNM